MIIEDKLSMFDKKGIFVKESKNRFLCEVIVDDRTVECYIPSSCRLDNFLQLSGRTVLLSRNKSNSSRTEYSVTAIPYKASYLLLNTSLSNKLIFENISSRRFSFIGTRNNILKEQKIGTYKADLLVAEKTKTLIEIKSIITQSNDAIFPTVYSQRAIDQLRHIYDLLLSGYKACYFFVSLNPYVKNIKINSDIKEYHALLADCIKQGMVLKGYTCKLINNSLTITKEIPISL
jgi:DNA-binding sugar fermentation-stimulating protein